MFTSQVPRYLWGEALLTATYLINRMPSKILNYRTPFSLFKDNFPNSKLITDLSLRVFGCSVFVHLHNQGKLDPRAKKCVFVGYASNKKGYKCYDPIDRKIIVTMDVTFVETKSYFHSNLQGGNYTKEDSIIDQEETRNIQHRDSNNREGEFIINTKINDVNVNEKEDEGAESDHENKEQTKELIVYSRRNRNQESGIHQIHHQESNPQDPVKSPGKAHNPANEFSDLDIPIAKRKGVKNIVKYPMSNFVSYKALSSTFSTFVSCLDTVQIPKNVKDALQVLEWKEAILEEMCALEKTGTWETMELPVGKKIVGCKWVFTTKFKPDGSLDRYKARLVAEGYTQTYGIDYLETFAPVAKLNSVRVLLSIAVNLDWSLQQLDMKNAFLNGKLEEEVYMDPPPGFEEKFRTRVCKLKKSLYGLKQSPQAWFERFTQVVKKQGYSQGQADHTMFYRHSQKGRIVVIIVYVDDIILTGDDVDEIRRLKEHLALEFEIKDLGPLKYFLGMKVARSKKGLVVSQKKCD
ncbi:hypothetical protein PVK06_020890 [Gossypium arboreum]|uniref:Retrovirus-related Pol polyprotein from transposon TNT 1-94 n=1 Tax=Gossypium arboreum TaxID=29729 RepID=A0ABR0PNJ1_GOSAR|nr:hypothetical protein PVK06_020890 [Gossypium arboreum]